MKKKLGDALAFCVMLYLCGFAFAGAMQADISQMFAWPYYLIKALLASPK